MKFRKNVRRTSTAIIINKVNSMAPKVIFTLLTGLSLVLFACNNDKATTGSDAAGSPQSQADSLEKIVVEAHDIAMPKWHKIPEIQKEARRLLDSLAKLPAAARKAAEPYMANLNGLVKDLDSANLKMESWMDAYGQKIMSLNADTTLAALQEKISYLTSQQVEVGAVKEAVLQSIAKADSLLKAKF